MVFEFCSGGDLAKYIQRYKRLTEANAQRLMRQLGINPLYSILSILYSI